jgi:rod shape determining protein RodA
MDRPGLERTRRESFFGTLDYWLLVPVLLISTMGLFALSGVLATDYDGATAVFVKQAGAVMAGITIAVLLCLVDIPTLKLVGWATYGVGLFLLILVLVDTFTMEASTGSDSWLSIPVIGTLQPSEIVKAGLAMCSAYVFEDMNLKRITYLKGSLRLALLYLPVLALIMKQPDLGTSIVIVFMFVCMLFVWGIRARFFLIALSGSLLAAIPIFLFVLQPFQRNRLLAFLFPGLDPDMAFQVERSRLAIGSGGLIGNLTGTHVVVPVKASDFIYAGLAERMGFVGAVALVCFIFFFLARTLYVASRAPTPATSYMAAGIAAVFAFHYIENLGMNIGLMPVTGIPLPFVSLGGTAMVVNFFALGVLLAISMERRRSPEPPPDT